MDWTTLGIDTRGETHGEIKTICPKCSSSRRKKSYPCLNVNLDRGVWNCWHCGWSGALKDAVRPAGGQVRPYRKPQFAPAPLPAPALTFLANRGITPEVVGRNQISSSTIYMPQIEEEVEAIAFPYVKGGEIVNVKYRDREKNFRQESGAEKTFYKYDDIDPKCTVICEGEIDALSLEVAGFRNAISVPDGAPSPTARSLENKFTYLDDPVLDAVEKVIIAVDSDAPGRKLEEELSRRLGRERCWRTIWPEDCKDANEVLMKHGVEVLRHCVQSATPFPVEGIVDIDDYSSEMDAIFANGLPTGISTGWANVDQLYKPSEGQWTLVTGIPGMGKSEWLDALAVNLSKLSGWTFGVCSPENQPVTYHGVKLMEKYVGKRLNLMTKEEYDDAKLWLSVYFKFILPGDRTIDTVLAKARLLVKRYGMKGLIIDPYNELVHSGRRDGVTETEYISEFLANIRVFARETGTHVWLVAHPKMLRREGADGSYPVPTGYDVAGSAHFFNKADNIVVVHRDKRNPEARTEVHVQKIRSRWLGQLGMTTLEWDAGSGRFSNGESPYYSMLR
jgi:twinkle protein